MATFSATRPTETAEFGDYVHVLRRRWRWPLVCALLGVALAYAYTQGATPVYTAHAEVLVTPQTAPNSSVRIDQAVSMPTEAQIGSSGAVASIARRDLGTSEPSATLVKDLEVSSDTESLVLDFAYTAATPQAAADASNAFAHAYLTYKNEQAATDTANELAGYKSQITTLEKQRAARVSQLRNVDPTSIKYQRINTQIQNLDLIITSINSTMSTIVPGLEAQQGKLILTAVPPTAPSSPNPPVDLALGFLVGLFFGTLLAFLRDRVDEKVRGRRHLNEIVDAPVLAVVPHAHVPRKRAWIATADDPRGPAAESYRTLRTNILAMAARHDLKVLAVSSAMADEGKSTTSANLAMSLAQAGKQTLLVSGDLRKPGLSRLFGMPNTWGLVDVLRRGAPLSDVVHATAIDRLKILNTGPIPGSPAELLQSPRMRQLIEEQREIFDFVIVDCSPVLGLADALAVAPIADGVILVASGRSRQAALAEARAELDQVGARVVGTVLNDIPLKRLKTKAYGYGGSSYRYVATDRPLVLDSTNGNGHPVSVGRGGASGSRD